MVFKDINALAIQTADIAYADYRLIGDTMYQQWNSNKSIQTLL